MEHSKKSVFKPVLDFESRSLAICLEKIAEQKQLLHLVQTGLPAEISVHACHCVLAGTRLLIYTDSAAWASQIRFFQQGILNKLRESGQQNIAGLQLRISPPMVSQQPRGHARLPSAESTRHLQSSVRRDANDELDSALTRLADTLQKRLRGDS